MTGGLPIYIILQALVAVLDPLVAAKKGSVIIAHDPAESLELLANAPPAWRIILGVDDETSLENYDAVLGASDTHITTTVQGGIGLPSDPASAIYLSRADGTNPSILELAEGARAWMRGISLQHSAIDCHITFSWRHTGWVKAQMEGKPPQFGRQHTFAIRHNISLPAAVAGNPFSITWPSN